MEQRGSGIAPEDFHGGMPRYGGDLPSEARPADDPGRSQLVLAVWSTFVPVGILDRVARIAPEDLPGVRRSRHGGEASLVGGAAGRGDREMAACSPLVPEVVLDRPTPAGPVDLPRVPRPRQGGDDAVDAGAAGWSDCVVAPLPDLVVVVGILHGAVRRDPPQLD